MNRRDDIPVFDYPGRDFVVGYIKKENLFDFLYDWNQYDVAQDCILSYIQLAHCGGGNGKVFNNYKGALTSFRDYSKEKEKYIKDNNLAEDDIGDYEIFNPTYTIEPKDLTSENCIYYKVVIYSLSLNYIQNFLEYRFENEFKKWENLFFVVNKN